MKLSVENNYELDPESKSCWIKARNISVYIKVGDEGVGVMLYPLGYESMESLGETWATWGEGADPEFRPWSKE